LCSRAGVARSTFYTHFADTHDVVAFVIDELFDELGVADVQRRASHALSRRESTEIGMREFFKGLENRRLFVLRSLSAPASVQVRERLTARMASTLGSTILTERPNSDHRYLEVSSRYISSGVLGVVLGWLEDPADLTSDELIALVIDLLPDWLTEGAP
jgi:AcrR family transcriptional regulator